MTMKTQDETLLTTGDGRIVSLSDIWKTYRTCVNRSVPIKGRINFIDSSADEYHYSVQCLFSTDNCDTLKKVKTTKVYSVDTSIDDQGDEFIKMSTCVSDPIDSSDLATAISPDKRYKACLKASGEAGDKQVLEIWDHDKLVKTIDTSDCKEHGLINVDPVFSSFVWAVGPRSGDSIHKLLYICNKKKPKSTPVTKLTEETIPSDLWTKSEYTKQETWGECLDGVEHTMIAVLDLDDNFSLTTLDVEGFSLADAHWCDLGRKIVSTAYAEEPRRLGLVYCNNRPSKLVIHDLATKSIIFDLSDKTSCFHTPRVTNDGQRLIYLSNPTFGAHYQPSRISILNLSNFKSKNLIDKTTGSSEWFIDSIPVDCFDKEDKSILFTTSDHLRQYVTFFNIDENKMEKIDFPTEGVSILDYMDNIILAVGSEINSLPYLFLGYFNEKVEKIKWLPINYKDDMSKLQLKYIEYNTFQIPGGDDCGLFISGILVKPKLNILQSVTDDLSNHSAGLKFITDQRKLPTVVVVHGGPHSAFNNTFSPATLFYARLGIQLLLINYRGSTGVSAAYSDSLCGKIGKQDVNDCLAAIRHHVKKGYIDPTKLIISGGSHGGFLACHLSCQEEFKFTSAVIRNPVTEVSSMQSTSDIPDWCYSTAVGCRLASSSSQLTTDDLVKMFECSPMSIASKADVPTLMLLGNKDKRVNMFQGERWIDSLRARGVETLCKVYPDEHSLGTLATSSDSSVTAAVWMLQHL